MRMNIKIKICFVFLFLSFVFNVTMVNAIPSPDFYYEKECNLFGGKMVDFYTSSYNYNYKICELPNGIKCITDIVANNKNYANYEQCNKYVTIPCIEENKYEPFSSPHIVCCEGLTSIIDKSDYYKDKENNKCILKDPEPTHSYLCTKCGDKICMSPYETECNCPVDCAEKISFIKKIVNLIKKLFFYFITN